MVLWGRRSTRNGETGGPVRIDERGTMVNKDGRIIAGTDGRSVGFGSFVSLLDVDLESTRKTEPDGAQTHRAQGAAGDCRRRVKAVKRVSRAARKARRRERETGGFVTRSAGWWVGGEWEHSARPPLSRPAGGFRLGSLQVQPAPLSPLRPSLSVPRITAEEARVALLPHAGR